MALFRLLDDSVFLILLLIAVLIFSLYTFAYLPFTYYFDVSKLANTKN